MEPTLLPGDRVRIDASAAGGAGLAFLAAQAELLPLAFLSASVALAQSLSMFVQLPVALRLLRRRFNQSALLALGAAALPSSTASAAARAYSCTARMASSLPGMA